MKSHVIHTVGPRYNDKYKTAAENALHNCYRSVLQVLTENKLRTVGFCLLNAPKRGYPREEAAHVALRRVSSPLFSIFFPLFSRIFFDIFWQFFSFLFFLEFFFVSYFFLF